MRFTPLSLIAPALLLASTFPCSASPRVHRGPTAQRAFKQHNSARPRVSEVRVIAPERATQIQTALISNGYLSGTPSGIWDGETRTAMEKLQADNGWQTRLVPDARAIIKLGLGPSVTTASTEPTTIESKP